MVFFRKRNTLINVSFIFTHNWYGYGSCFCLKMSLWWQDTVKGNCICLSIVAKITQYLHDDYIISLSHRATMGGMTGEGVTIPACLTNTLSTNSREEPGGFQPIWLSKLNHIQCGLLRDFLFFRFSILSISTLNFWKLS